MLACQDKTPAASPADTASQIAADTGETAEPEDVTDCEHAGWGAQTPCPPEYFAAADVPEDQVALIRDAHAVSSEAWGNFGPLEYWVVGHDEDAADALNEVYCQLRIERDDNLTAADEVYCLNRDYSFADYARDGGAGLNTQHDTHTAYSVFIVTMASKYPGPHETDYTVVAYHEYFHVVQMAHIASRERSEQQALMRENPWWAEGGAEYMAQLLYSRQPGVAAGYLPERMAWKMSSVDDLAEGESFTEIPYGERARIAYDLGTWFIAFLIHQVGEDAFAVHFFDDLNDLGWDGAFEENFGRSSEAMLADFEVFLTLPLEDQLAILP